MSFRSDDDEIEFDDSFRRWCCQEEVDEKEEALFRIKALNL